MIISIIAAVSENGVIGIENRLPWKLSDDLKHFKAITLGKFVIMGRVTFDSIGKPLSGRTNIVLTRNKSFNYKGVTRMYSLSSAIDFARDGDQEEVFIIGGADLYRQSITLADKIYLTKVAIRLEGDAYFPELNWKEWNIRSRIYFAKNDKNEFSFEILELERLE